MGTLSWDGSLRFNGEERECLRSPETRPPELRCDFEWMLIEERLPHAQHRYGKEYEHGWPYETTVLQ